jgi:hypothetical protein
LPSGRPGRHRTSRPSEAVRLASVEPSRLVDAYRRAPPPDQAAQLKVELPGPDEPISFDKHLRPLFRDRDQQSMKFAFDLWSCDDVKTNAQAILERLESGTMPCDGAWPREQIAAVKRWLQSGMSP